MFNFILGISIFTDCFYKLSLGFAVLFINYRGSTGLGKDYVESLLGNIGDADVKDVYNAVQSNPLWSNRKLLLYGGSHGGFLVTHLSGQYPVSIIMYTFEKTNIIFYFTCA